MSTLSWCIICFFASSLACFLGFICGRGMKPDEDLNDCRFCHNMHYKQGHHDLLLEDRTYGSE